MKINPAIATPLQFMCSCIVLIHSVIVFYLYNLQQIYYFGTTQNSQPLASPDWKLDEDPTEVKSQSQENLASSLGCRGIHFFVPSVFWGIPNLFIHIFPFFLAPPSVSFFFCSFFHNQVFPDQSPESHNTFAGSCDETGTQADSLESPNYKAPNHMYKVPLCSMM